MSEITEMILDGVLCEICTIYLGDEVGFPRLCDHCARDCFVHGGCYIRNTGLPGDGGKQTYQRVPWKDQNGVEIPKEAVPDAVNKLREIKP